MADEKTTFETKPETGMGFGYQPKAGITIEPANLKPPTGGPAIEPPKPQAPAQPPQAPPSKK